MSLLPSIRSTHCIIVVVDCAVVVIDVPAVVYQNYFNLNWNVCFVPSKNRSDRRTLPHKNYLIISVSRGTRRLIKMRYDTDRHRTRYIRAQERSNEMCDSATLWCASVWERNWAAAASHRDDGVALVAKLPPSLRAQRYGCLTLRVTWWA